MILFSIVSWFSSLLPWVMSLRSWRTDRVARLVGYITAFSFLFDLTAFVLGWYRVNTYPIGNAFLLLQTILFLLIYRDALKIRKYLFYGIGGTYALFFIVNFFLIQGPFMVNSYATVVGSVGFIVLSLMYFRQLLNNLPETFVHRIPMVWVNIAALIYFSGNLFLFMLYNYMATMENWILHNMLNITKNVLLFVAVWQSQRKMTSSSS